jgi:peptidoglycan/LPS O-acetylase OafA/YrhL
MFYAVAPFIVRSKVRSLIFFLGGTAFLAFVTHPVGKAFEAGWTELVQPEPVFGMLSYFFFPSSFVFFGAGAIGYHAMHAFKNGEDKRLVQLLSVAFIGVLITRPHGMLGWKHLLFFMLAIPVIFEMTKRSKVDRWVGELSFPVYILHFPVLGAAQRFNVTHVTAVTLVGTLSLALIVLKYVDMPVERYRASLARRLRGVRENRGSEGVTIEQGREPDSKRDLGSGLVDHSQKMTVAARATAEKKAVGQRS